MREGSGLLGHLQRSPRSKSHSSSQPFPHCTRGGFGCGRAKRCSKSKLCSGTGTGHEDCFIEDKGEAPDQSGESAAAPVWSRVVCGGRSCEYGASQALVMAWHRLHKARMGRSSLLLHSVCLEGIYMLSAGSKGHPMQGHSPDMWQLCKTIHGKLGYAVF